MMEGVAESSSKDLKTGKVSLLDPLVCEQASTSEQLLTTKGDVVIPIPVLSSENELVCDMSPCSIAHAFEHNAKNAGGGNIMDGAIGGPIATGFSGALGEAVGSGKTGVAGSVGAGSAQGLNPASTERSGRSNYAPPMLRPAEPGQGLTMNPHEDAHASDPAIVNKGSKHELARSEDQQSGSSPVDIAVHSDVTTAPLAILAFKRISEPTHQDSPETNTQSASAPEGTASSQHAVVPFNVSDRARRGELVVEDAHASVTEAQSMAESPLAEESEQAEGGVLEAVSLNHAPTEKLQTEHNSDATDGQGVEESHLQSRDDQTAQASLEKLPSFELKRPGRLAVDDEATSGVQASHVAGVARGPPREQQKQPVNSSPSLRSLSAGWSNGGEQRPLNGGWQVSPGGRGNSRQERNPSFSRSQQLEIPQPLPGAPAPRRQASGGHGRGWQQAPRRYSPQGLGTGYQSRTPSGHNKSQNPYNPFLDESPPNKALVNGKRSSSLDSPARRGQSHSPESPLNWGGPGSPSVEELSLGPSVAQPLPPVPQPLPPSLAEGGSTYLTIEWQQSPLSQCYFLDMALSSERVRESDSPRVRAGEPERLVGESLDWRPVYSGKDFKCQVTGLKPGQSYWFRVRYVPAVTPPLAPPTPPPPSMPAFFWTHCSVPGAPAAPSLASRARSNLKVKWAPPSETGGKQVTQYQLKMRPPPARAEGSGGASWQADADGFVEIYQGSEPSCKVPRLVPGQDYAFRVRAFNCIGGGVFSPEAIFSTNPSVPAQPGPPSTVAQTPTSVTLQWEAPHSGGAEITAYVLEIDDGEGGAFAMVYTGPELICEIQALRAGYTYCCRVLAENEVGRSAFSVPVGFQTGRSTPFKPFPPVVSSRGPTSLTLAWEAPENDGGSEVLGYRVEVWHSGGGRGWTVLYEGPSRACTVNGLQPGQQYRVRVQAVNQVGLSENSDEVRVATAASAPQAMDAPALGDSHQNALLVRWAPPQHDGGARVAGYRVEMLEGGGDASDGFGRGKVVYSGLETAAWVKELQPGCAYSFRVQSWNKLGSSAWSPPITCQTLPGNPGTPGPPTLSLSAGSTSTATQLPLVWEAPASNGAPITSYCLQICVPRMSEQEKWTGESRTSSPQRRRPFSAMAESGSSTDLGDSSDVFKAAGFKGSTSDEATSVETDVGSVDDETVFDASSFSEGGQDSLEQGVKGEGLGGLRKSRVHDRVERWCQGAEELPFEDAYMSVNAATTVVGLMPHTLYAFRVRATNLVGSSDYSPISYLVTASAEPSAPAPPTVVETGPDYVHLKWERPARDNGESVDSYTLEIERRSSNRSASSSASPGGGQAGGRSKSRGARVVGIGGSTAAAFAAVSKEQELWEEVYSGIARECLVDCLDPGRPYQFRVRAWNAVGASPPSLSVQVPTDPAPPLPPAPPSFTGVTPTSVRVRWSPPEEDNGSTVRSYKLGADDGLGGPFRQMYEGSALKHTAVKLVPGRTYLFRVQAISEVGASAPSATASVKLPRAPPRAPLAPVAKSASSSTLVLVWAAPESEEEGEVFSSRTGFTLQMEERAGAYKTIYEGEKPTFEVKGLTPGTVYHFRVRSNGPADVEQGPWSLVAAIATEPTLEVARPKTRKAPSRLKTQLSKQIGVLHEEADKWQGLPMRRLVASVCLLVVLMSAYIQWA